jgi:hypothetical protein
VKSNDVVRHILDYNSVNIVLCRKDVRSIFRQTIRVEVFNLCMGVCLRELPK